MNALVMYMEYKAKQETKGNEPASYKEWYDWVYQMNLYPTY